MSAARQVLAALALVLLGLTAAAEARTWSWLGVRIRDLSEQEMEEVSKRHGIREGFGVVVVDVMEDTPAARAGMRNGDIVVALEGRPVTDTRLLAVRLVSMPRPVAGERIAAEFGFLLREADGARETGIRLQSSTAAPFVTVVLRGSAAQKAGLEVGDVILQINEQPVVTRDAVQETLSDVPLDRTLRLTVLREGRHVGLSLAGPEERPSP